LTCLDGVVDQQGDVAATTGRIGHILGGGDVQLDGYDVGVGHIHKMAGTGIDLACPPSGQRVGERLPEAAVGPGDEGHGTGNLHDLAPFSRGRLGAAPDPRPGKEPSLLCQ
jgi:hypothetical protein